MAPARPPSPSQPATYNRDAILAAIDLEPLADELLGARARGGWTCPNPHHPQTGRTPPLKVFLDRTGQQRWHCFGCDLGGTALDLVMQVQGVDVRAAFDELAHRSGLPLQELTGPGPNPSRPHRPAASTPAAIPVLEPVPAALERYVAECAETLWRPEGTQILRWLTKERRLPPELLRAHRVGADLGPRHQARPPGVGRWERNGQIITLPQQAVVLPVLLDGQACYLQLRMLGANAKYVNPDARYTNPRLGFYEHVQAVPDPWDRSRTLIVTEGIFDALAANAGGYRAAAVLAATYADPTAATALTRQPGQLVVAFDPDPAGRAGRDRLVQFLTDHHRPPGVMVLPHGDLNEHLRRAHDWPVELDGRVTMATGPGWAGRAPHHGIARAPLTR